MSHVNSERRSALGFSTPARAFGAMLGEDAAALLDANGVEDVALDGLNLTPELIERARAERDDARWPCLEGKRNRRTDRSAKSGKRWRAEHGTGTIETHLHRYFNWENAAPGARVGPRGHSASCGNSLFTQCVLLRSEINL